MIPYGRQSITQSDIDSVTEVLKSDFLTQGPQVPAFEARVAEAGAAEYAVAVNSATSALHIACLALDVSVEDCVWTSPISFVASSNCALYCGAKIDFVDIDPATFNMSAEKLEEKLIAAKKQNRLPKVVIPVHLCGQPCDMEAIGKLAKEYGFSVIEDASHAIGGKYQGQPIGNCAFSDITVFSFHPVKIVTTAEGGVATTQSARLASRMAMLRTHGITRDESLMNKPSDGPWYYEQIDLGYNYRMTELQAALGVSQMERLHGFVANRHELAERYDRLLTHLPISTPWQHPDSYSGRHLYVIELDLAKAKLSHKDTFLQLRERGIGVNLHYIPIHKQPYYAAMGFKEGDFPNAEAYYSRAISIPLYHGLTFEDQDRVIKTMESVLM